MSPKHILFTTTSPTLGEVCRDLAIARELRRARPDVDISWLVGEPSQTFLRNAGERLVPEADEWVDMASLFERTVDADRSNGRTFQFYWNRWYMSKAVREASKHNVGLFARSLERGGFDLVVCDHVPEINLARFKGQIQTATPFAYVYGYVGTQYASLNPIEIAIAYYANHVWQNFDRKVDAPHRIWAGDFEDVPDTRFGIGMPGRRQWIEDKGVHCVGQILRFDPSDYENRAAVRARLGYGDEPLVVVSIGGTAVGRPLLELCARAFPIARSSIPGLRMVLVCGGRLAPDDVELPGGVGAVDGLDVLGYVDQLYEHFAACDLAIVQAGGVSTLELAALRRPFLYFPLNGAFEQRVYVVGKLRRLGAGIGMEFDETTPESLAAAIVEHIGSEATWPAFATDGARRAAEVINGVL
jgi:UDP:flavonoid glycosyltransferase YjiC (YdhE family)